MSLKSRKSAKLRDLEITKITLMVDALKEKVKSGEPVSETDKKELLNDIGSSIDTIISYNPEHSAEPEEGKLFDWYLIDIWIDIFMIFIVHFLDFFEF